MKINPEITIEECEEKLLDLQKEIIDINDEYCEVVKTYEAYQMHLEFLKGNYKDITNTEL